MAVRLLVGIALTVAGGLTGLAQSIPSPPGPGTPRFEVASVKRHARSGTRSADIMQTQPGGRFTAIAMRVESLAMAAYRVRSFQLLGGPGWIHTDEFDVIAKASENTPPETIAAMLRSLLAERFKLRAHIESRDFPVYALERAGTESAKLPRSKVDCDASRKAAEPDPFSVVSAEKQKAKAETPAACFLERLRAARTSNGAMVLDLVKPGTSMADLARTLSGYVNRPVIDRTGLAGPYDVTLQFDAASITAPSATSVENAPSIFSALQEQLGLRLRSDRNKVDVLVIDNIEQPSPD